MYKYKDLTEQLTGFYQFGDEYFILTDFDNPHFMYTSVHERTHINLGSATSFGIFQKIINRFKSELIDQNSIDLFSIILDTSIENVAFVHESAATFSQFCEARHNKYKGINEMLKTLPEEYKEFKKIFEILFNNCKIPFRAQGWIAYQIARISMETNILEDFKDFKSFPNIENYFNIVNNNPNKRLSKIIDLLIKENIELVFVDFLSNYEKIENQLDDLYSNRSIINRGKTLTFQKELIVISDRIFRQIINKVGLTSYLPCNSSHAQLGNELIENWQNHLALNKSINSFHYKLTSTESLNVDPFDLGEIIIPPHKALDNLIRIENTPKVFDLYVARIWFHKSDIPKNLAYNLNLYKGNIYIRYYGFDNREQFYYNLTVDPSIIKRNIKHPFNCTLCDGIDYEFIKSVDPNFNRGLIIFYWQKYESIPKDVIFGRKLKHYLFYHPNFYIALFQNDVSYNYHLIFFNGNSIIEELKKQSDQFLPFNEEDSHLSKAIDIILSNFDTIF